MKDIIAILVVIYGGELICCKSCVRLNASCFELTCHPTGSWLQFTPSFLLYPAYPIIFALAQVFINALPSTIIPPMSIHTELPLSLFDALTRSWLLTTGNPAFIVGHAREDVRGSPFALVVASLVLANGGFFLINFFQMLSPYGYHVRTPPEFRTAGWTTMDLWIAPLITALYAILTHTQPFWVPIHTIFIKQVSRKTLLFGRVLLVSDMVENDEGEWSEILKEYVKPMGKEEARSVLAILVCLLFAYRAIVNFGLEWVRMKRKKMIKTREYSIRGPIQVSLTRIKRKRFETTLKRRS